jgi:epoxyqueuosine reductase
MEGLKSDDIKEFLRQEGVDLVGFTSVEVFEDWDDIFHGRLADGTLPSRYGRELYADPCRLLPGARSIVIFATSYPGFAGDDEPGYASICGVAWARKRAKEITASLVDFLGEEGHQAIEASDIPLKATAVRAGIAMQRKNTVAYTEEGDSAVRFSAVVTELQMPPGEEGSSHPCGECTKCIEACPTGALTDDYVLDARKCLCYLLEHDSDFPEELRPMTGSRLLGCDACQAICPHNRDVPTLSAQGFPWLNLEDLAEEVIEDPEGLNRKLCIQHRFPLFSEYTISRTVAINLGNWGAPQAVPLLRRLEESRWPEVADAARWALQRIEE